MDKFLFLGKFCIKRKAWLPACVFQPCLATHIHAPRLQLDMEPSWVGSQLPPTREEAELLLSLNKRHHEGEDCSTNDTAQQAASNKRPMLSGLSSVPMIIPIQFPLLLTSIGDTSILEGLLGPSYAHQLTQPVPVVKPTVLKPITVSKPAEAPKLSEASESMEKKPMQQVLTPFQPSVASSFSSIVRVDNNLSVADSNATLNDSTVSNDTPAVTSLSLVTDNDTPVIAANPTTIKPVSTISEYRNTQHKKVDHKKSKFTGWQQDALYKARKKGKNPGQTPAKHNFHKAVIELYGDQIAAKQKEVLQAMNAQNCSMVVTKEKSEEKKEEKRWVFTIENNRPLALIMTVCKLMERDFSERKKTNCSNVSAPMVTSGVISGGMEVHRRECLRTELEFLNQAWKKCSFWSKVSSEKISFDYCLCFCI